MFFKKMKTHVRNLTKVYERRKMADEKKKPCIKEAIQGGLTGTSSLEARVYRHLLRSERSKNNYQYQAVTKGPYKLKSNEHIQLVSEYEKKDFTYINEDMAQKIIT